MSHGWLAEHRPCSVIRLRQYSLDALAAYSVGRSTTPVFLSSRVEPLTDAALPAVVVLGGRNGAGKSTAAPRLLRESLRVEEFVNADTLAQGLSAFRPEDVALEAGRITLKRLDDLESQRKSFAFESTLSSQALASRLSRLRERGYKVHIVYLWLPTADLAVARVAERVAAGGHDVPSEAVRRRFDRGRHNFFTRYRRLANTWRLYDASAITGPRLVAAGGLGKPTTLRDPRRGAKRHKDMAMSDSEPTLDELFEDGRAIDDALFEAARDARRLHKALGNPMATCRDGEVVWVQPKDIVVDGDPVEDPGPSDSPS
jgi:predicted ABC-type ATPase